MFKPLLFLIFFHVFSISSQANEADSLLFGVEITDYPPYFFLDKKQHYAGAARDILDLFSSTINKRSEYQPMAVPRLFHEFVEGRVDLKFPDNPLWSASLKSDVKVFYSDPVFNINDTLLVLKQESEEIPAEDIMYVGTILGFSTPGIEKNVANKEFELVKVNKIEQLIHMLASNRIQALFFNEKVALNLSQKLYPLKQLTGHSNYPSFHYSYHLSSIEHPELIQSFNKFLVNHDKQVAEIRNQYGLE